MNEIVEMIIHTDDYLLGLVADNLYSAYFLLCLIIFLETGNILFPFLPGDGLLFSAGVVATQSGLNVWVLLFLLICAAVLGNLVNYQTGKSLGSRLEQSSNFFIQRFLLKYLPRAEKFYQKYGGRAIIIGRFFPVIRTYVPFLAGMSHLSKKVFIYYTVLGAVLWVTLFLLAGYFVGEIPWVRNNYGAIFLLLIFVTLIPILFTLMKNYFKRRSLIRQNQDI